MTNSELIKELRAKLPEELATDLVSQFASIRADVATATLEKATPGKFVESVVQVLQYVATGTYSQSFKSGELDDFLKNAEARPLALPPDLRTVVTRVARGMYSLRSKRGIVHKGGIDPNVYDLRYLFFAAQWVLSEIIRHVLSTEMETAARLVEFIQVPVTPLVEDFGDKRIVLREGTSMKELLILLLYYYPEYIMVPQLKTDMNRRAKSTVSNTIKSAYAKRLVEGDGKTGYKLTSLGYQQATEIVKRAAVPQADS